MDTMRGWFTAGLLFVGVTVACSANNDPGGPGGRASTAPPVEAPTIEIQKDVQNPSTCCCGQYNPGTQKCGGSTLTAQVPSGTASCKDYCNGVNDPSFDCVKCDATGTTCPC